MNADSQCPFALVPGAEEPQAGGFTSIPSQAGPVLGNWYWVTPAKNSHRAAADEWLGCAMQVGSNFVEIHAPQTDGGRSYVRVHFNDFWTKLRHEPDANAVIRQRVGFYQGESVRLMGKIEEVTHLLGMIPQAQLGAAAQGDAGGALMVLSSQHDPKAYSTALEVAKKTTLPALFEEVKTAHASLAKWMKAPVMSVLAGMADQNSIVKDIDDRIFSVSLYAGLTEESVKIADGAPAEILDKLHVMQRMAYMDEECLANYKVGGMEFRDIGQFDAWLAEPENRDRILPFPRTLVAMRVRRNAKERDWEGSINTLVVNLNKEQLDKLTFLYIRNGDQLWRINTEIDFGSLIFPDASVFDPNEPKMAKMFCGNVKEFVSVHYWEQMRDRQIETRRKAKEWHEEWKKEHAGENSWGRNPYETYTSDRHEDYEPVDSTSVYFDESTEKIAEKVKEYNRVALIIQGLFDRSLCLHPHLPAKTWSADGFDKAVKLIYDGTGTLFNGEAPDFEAYRARCNASLSVASQTIGQDDFWQRAEGTKESARRDNDYRNRAEYRPERFKPYGNPGPGYIARITKWSKKNGATFEWKRDRQRYIGYDQSQIAASITVPASELFNVSAYKAGDFKRFFQDPRTRQHYLQWAPMLIAAEEYHAGLAALSPRINSSQE